MKTQSLLGLAAAGLASLCASAQNLPDPAPAPPFNTTYGDVAKVVSAKPVQESMTGERMVAYDVTYEYNGRQFNIRMPYDPGQQMPVNVDVRPPMPRPPLGRHPGVSPQNPRYRGT